MTPETLRIDMIFRGVGRIAKASGTTDPVVRRRIKGMLREFASDGRLDLLKAIRDGQLDLMTVYDAYRRRSVHELPLGATVQSLDHAFTAWKDSLVVPRDASKKHVESLETSRRYFNGVNESAQVNDLPAILDELRESLGKAHPRSFNLARAAALAFVRSTLKRSHPLYVAVAAVEPRKVTKQHAHHPLSVAEMRKYFPNPKANVLDAMAWSMATTGMHQSEYWGQWHTLADRIHIAGTKRKGRVRDVPRIFTPTVPAMHRRTFENKVRERSKAFTVRDLRRTYAHWLEEAQIPRTRRRTYMGHGEGDVTGLYEKHEVTAYLAEDTAKLKAFLARRHTIRHTVGKQRRPA